MHYKVYATSVLRNISSISCEQTFPLSLKCGHCLEAYSKLVTITSESVVHNTHGEKSNLLINCKKCSENQMEISIKPPTEQKIDCDSTNVYKSEKIDDEKFLVTEFMTKGCEIVGVPMDEFYVEDFHENIYKAKVDASGAWQTNDRSNDAIIIEALKIEIVELQHH